MGSHLEDRSLLLLWGIGGVMDGWTIQICRWPKFGLGAGSFWSLRSRSDGFSMYVWYQTFTFKRSIYQQREMKKRPTFKIRALAPYSLEKPQLDRQLCHKMTSSSRIYSSLTKDLRRDTQRANGGDLSLRFAFDTCFLWMASVS